MKLADLTPRRRQIVELLAQGKTDKEIANELGLAEATINRHIWLISESVEVSRGAGTRWAIVRYFYRLEAID